MKGLHKLMQGRNPHESHRVATTLELFFDLVYVVSISSAAAELHEYLAHGLYAEGFFAYFVAFFAIWLSWLNYSWFASAYDTEDFRFRLYTFIQIFGALIFAVGLKGFFSSPPSFTLGVTGYVIMRIALVMQWLRAAREDEARRQTCLRHALGIGVMQTLWVLWLFLPFGIQRIAMPLLMLGELLVPTFATRAGATPWHPHHIAERYGLLTIIVLGEGVLASTQAVRQLIPDTFELSVLWGEPLLLALGASALIFLLWWAYFKLDWGESLGGSYLAIYAFGYAHYIIYASLAVVSVGISLIADVCISGHRASILPEILIASSAVGVYLLILNLFRVGVFHRCRYRYSSFVWIALSCAIAPLSVAWGLPVVCSLLLLALAPLGYIILTDEASTQPAE